MKEPIRIAVMGYGNLGRGVECAVKHNTDMILTGVFTRRDPKSIHLMTPQVPVFSAAALSDHADDIDVLILCGGSATDLPQQTPAYASMFNVIDSFDTHAKIPSHFTAVDAAAQAAGKIAVISCGWDPGMFSLARLYGQSILPEGKEYTFWGKGISQGHSDAIRRIPGVKDARQYTIPSESALQTVRSGDTPELTTRQKHTRECFVVTDPNADQEQIREAIVTMPNYFAEYDTAVHFVSEETLKEEHSGMPHGGTVIRSGKTGWNKEYRNIIEYDLTLESNPMFTASVLTACARAAVRMNEEGLSGCKTLFDIPPAYLSPLDEETLRKTYL